MAGDAGVGGKGLISGEGCHIGAADAHILYFQQCLALFYLGHEDLPDLNLIGFGNYDRFHVIPFPQ